MSSSMIGMVSSFFERIVDGSRGFVESTAHRPFSQETRGQSNARSRALGSRARARARGARLWRRARPRSSQPTPSGVVRPLSPGAAALATPTRAPRATQARGGQSQRSPLGECPPGLHRVDVPGVGLDDGSRRGPPPSRPSMSPSHGSRPRPRSRRRASSSASSQICSLRSSGCAAGCAYGGGGRGGHGSDVLLQVLEGCAGVRARPAPADPEQGALERRRGRRRSIDRRRLRVLGRGDDRRRGGRVAAAAASADGRAAGPRSRCARPCRPDEPL